MKSNKFLAMSKLLATTLLCTQVHSGVFENSNLLEIESTSFFSDSEYHQKTNYPMSLLVEPSFYYSMDHDRELISFRPYFRVDSQDGPRTHVDIRELSYTLATNGFELRAGISKVFWGVSESVHLVDVINQTDLIEGIDGEEKLGQPMLNLSYQGNMGNISGFILPYFRERTLPGKDDRLRLKQAFNTDDSLYTDKEKEKHIDYALRWSHYYEELEWGFSYFKGTNRDPMFKLSDVGELVPLYTQIEQLSIDTQLITGDWLLKLEALKRNDHSNENYLSSVAGLEYTFANIEQKGWDLGILYEHIYDERGDKSGKPFFEHSFLGARVALNDVMSSELLVGAFFSNETGNLTSFAIEASRRLNSSMSFEAILNIVGNPKKSGALNQIKKDDHLRLALTYYF